MQSGDHGMNPFSSEDLWRISKFTIEALPPLEELPWDSSLSANREDNDLVTRKGHAVPESVWKLDFFSDNLERPHSPTISTAGPSEDTESTAPPSVQHDATEVEAIWQLDSLNAFPKALSPLKTWDRQFDPQHRERVSAYFTESGARGFDAALSRQAQVHGKPIAGRLVNEDIFLRSVFQLGLGWSSPLFRYNEHAMTFDTAVDNMRVSGVSMSMLQSLISSVLPCGVKIQLLRRFTRTVPGQPTDLPSLFTLRGTVGVILRSLEAQVLGLSHQIVSLLQVSSLFRTCGDLVNAVADIVQAAQQSTSDADVISTVLDRASQFAQAFGRMENLLFEIVARISSPWLEFAEHWIGLSPENDALNGLIAGGKMFVELRDHDVSTRFKTVSKRTDYDLIMANIPSFVPKDLARTMFECGKSLRLLKKSHPAHPIGRRDVISQAGNFTLQIATTWDGIERIQRQAQSYESNLRKEILRYQRARSHERKSELDSPRVDTGSSTVLDSVYELFDVDDETRLQDSALEHKDFVDSKLARLMQNTEEQPSDLVTTSSRFGPELPSALYLSLAPVVSSQSQLVDYSYLHHLFKEHNLRHHLSLQRRFQLLGDGPFATRLSTALFDSEMESGERKRGVVRTGIHTGLRLGSRDAWPPASSELRLVLNGLLGECYSFNEDPITSDHPNTKPEGKELPGGLSFAIRDLTDAEVEQCRNPNAIEALDFLRLQYKPPEALEVLLTPKSLTRYDRLFKHLLRLFRMMTVVKEIVRDSTHRGSTSGDPRNNFQRFRVEAQHFVLALSDYCFQVAIGLNWSNFQKSLDRIEHCLDRGDIDGTIEVAHSVPRLRGFHEDILDQMLFAMFLSKRHSQAAKLLDSIFGTILSFVPHSKAEGWQGLRHENEEVVLHLYSTFQKHTSAFAAYLRALDPSKASAKPMGKSGTLLDSSTDTWSIFEHLRIRLNMKEYY
ncbi:hypothetical protein N7539_002593 [Penicillium diatomitis]|uniref:Spindle pole body component n=1 Tax=Penicillium diatomitis TaxID=2819901 RepID=A0A9W9XF84_9EURO|nr:uncharacterized protein N7539_002593 [Penicillium diatomitis]KAJ5491026.1 hypothetical protein N7539_002593 [Penicillium diatomitis]